jgi:hypothetical protein
MQRTSELEYRCYCALNVKCGLPAEPGIFPKSVALMKFHLGVSCAQ